MSTPKQKKRPIDATSPNGMGAYLNAKAEFFGTVGPAQQSELISAGISAASACICGYFSATTGGLVLAILAAVFVMCFVAIIALRVYKTIREPNSPTGTVRADIGPDSVVLHGDFCDPDQLGKMIISQFNGRDELLIPDGTVGARGPGALDDLEAFDEEARKLVAMKIEADLRAHEEAELALVTKNLSMIMQPPIAIAKPAPGTSLAE